MNGISTLFIKDTQRAPFPLPHVRTQQEDSSPSVNQDVDPH